MRLRRLRSAAPRAPLAASCRAGACAPACSPATAHPPAAQHGAARRAAPRRRRRRPVPPRAPGAAPRRPRRPGRAAAAQRASVTRTVQVGRQRDERRCRAPAAIGSSARRAGRVVEQRPKAARRRAARPTRGRPFGLDARRAARRAAACSVAGRRRAAMRCGLGEQLLDSCGAGDCAAGRAPAASSPATLRIRSTASTRRPSHRRSRATYQQVGHPGCADRPSQRTSLAATLRLGAAASMRPVQNNAARLHACGMPARSAGVASSPSAAQRAGDEALDQRLHARQAESCCVEAPQRATRRTGRVLALEHVERSAIAMGAGVVRPLRNTRHATCARNRQARARRGRAAAARSALEHAARPRPCRPMLCQRERPGARLRRCALGAVAGRNPRPRAAIAPTAHRRHCQRGQARRPGSKCERRRGSRNSARKLLDQRAAPRSRRRVISAGPRSASTRCAPRARRRRASGS